MMMRNIKKRLKAHVLSIEYPGYGIYDVEEDHKGLKSVE